MKYSPFWQITHWQIREGKLELDFVEDFLDYNTFQESLAHTQSHFTACVHHDGKPQHLEADALISEYWADIAAERKDARELAAAFSPEARG